MVGHVALQLLVDGPSRPGLPSSTLGADAARDPHEDAQRPLAETTFEDATMKISTKGWILNFFYEYPLRFAVATAAGKILLSGQDSARLLSFKHKILRYQTTSGLKPFFRRWDCGFYFSMEDGLKTEIGDKFGRIRLSESEVYQLLAFLEKKLGLL